MLNEIVARHNARVLNPETHARSKGYYEFRAFCRSAVKLVVNLFWVAMLCGLFFGVIFVASWVGEVLISWTK